MQFEVCIDDAESLRILNSINSTQPPDRRIGRVEVCGPLSVGGTTPSIGFVSFVNSTSTIPFRVMLRPRTGDFQYNEDEIRVLLADADNIERICRGNRLFEGFVLGLTRNGRLDSRTLKVILAKIGVERITLHRAVDVTTCPIHQLADDLIELGPKVDTVLTSGRSANGALAGLATASELQAALIDRHSNITVMIGSGINEHNIHLLGKEPWVRWIHGSFSAVAEQDDAFRFGCISRPSEGKVRAILNMF